MTFKPIDNVKALIERLAVDEEARNLIEPALADKSRLILRILKRVEQLDVGSTAAFKLTQNALAVRTRIKFKKFKFHRRSP